MPVTSKGPRGYSYALLFGLCLAIAFACNRKQDDETDAGQGCLPGQEKNSEGKCVAKAPAVGNEPSSNTPISSTTRTYGFSNSAGSTGYGYGSNRGGYDYDGEPDTSPSPDNDSPSSNTLLNTISGSSTNTLSSSNTLSSTNRTLSSSNRTLSSTNRTLSSSNRYYGFRNTNTINSTSFRSSFRNNNTINSTSFRSSFRNTNTIGSTTFRGFGNTNRNTANSRTLSSNTGSYTNYRTFRTPFGSSSTTSSRNTVSSRNLASSSNSTFVADIGTLPTYRPVDFTEAEKNTNQPPVIQLRLIHETSGSMYASVSLSHNSPSKPITEVAYRYPNANIVSDNEEKSDGSIVLRNIRVPVEVSLKYDGKRYSSGVQLVGFQPKKHTLKEQQQ